MFSRILVSHHNSYAHNCSQVAEHRGLLHPGLNTIPPRQLGTSKHNQEATWSREQPVRQSCGHDDKVRTQAWTDERRVMVANKSELTTWKQTNYRVPELAYQENLLKHKLPR